MIDEKIIELINKEIDNNISPGEQIKLRDFLSKNDSAREYYNDLIQTNKMLEQLPEPEPPSYLKQRITNSIDFSLYPKKKKSLFGSHLDKAALRKRYIRLAFTFTFGMVIGFMVYAFFFGTLNTPYNTENISGTMTNIKAKTFHYVPLNLSDISGNIEIKGHENKFWCYFNFNTFKECELKILYPKNMVFNYISPGAANKLKFSKDDHIIAITNSGLQKYNLNFSRFGGNASSLRIIILQSGNKLYDHTFLLE